MKNLYNRMSCVYSSGRMPTSVHRLTAGDYLKTPTNTPRHPLCIESCYCRTLDFSKRHTCALQSYLWLYKWCIQVFECLSVGFPQQVRKGFHKANIFNAIASKVIHMFPGKSPISHKMKYGTLKPRLHHCMITIAAHYAPSTFIFHHHCLFAHEPHTPQLFHLASLPTGAQTALLDCALTPYQDKDCENIHAESALHIRVQSFIHRLYGSSGANNTNLPPRVIPSCLIHTE